MDAERKATILKEINYWKSHHLLPVHYCDFLIALYTEGEGNEGEENDTDTRKTPYYLLFYFFNTFLLLIPMLVYLTIDRISLQIITTFITLLINIWMIRVFRNHEKLNEGYAVMMLFVNFLFSSSIILNELMETVSITYLWIFINSISWIIFGKWKKQLFLQIAGVFVFIIACIVTGFYYI